MVFNTSETGTYNEIGLYYWNGNDWEKVGNYMKSPNGTIYYTAVDDSGSFYSTTAIPPYITLSPNTKEIINPYYGSFILDNKAICALGMVMSMVRWWFMKHRMIII